jgi:signal transduction histidine kinase
MTAAGLRGDAQLLRRVRWRLVAWSAGSTLVILLLLAAALYASVRTSLDGTGTRQLTDRAVGIEDFINHQRAPQFDPGGEPGEDSPFGQTVFGGPASGTLAYLVDLDGDIVGAGPVNIDGLPLADGVEAAAAGDTRDVRAATVADTPVRVLSETVTIDGEAYVLQVIQDRTAEERVLGVLLLVLGVGGGAVLLTAGAVGFFYAGRALVPIRESLRRQRDFAADASHELRTPLAVVRTSVEHLRRHANQPVTEVGSALEDIEVEVAHLTRLVEDLLLLARSDSGEAQLLRVPTDLADVTGEALQGLRALAAARDVQLSLEAAPITVDGDPERLRQLVTILVDNAIRHSPAGGVVTIEVGSTPAPAVTVQDEGPGIRAEDLPHVFDRFWRAADAPQGGTGLGLAIGSWIADHHGASLTVASPPGGGARFEVRFPAR